MEKPDPKKTALAMSRYYERAFNQIMGVLVAGRKSDNYWKSAYQARLLRQIAEILDRFHHSSGNYLTRALHQVAEYESKLAIEDLKEFRTNMKHVKKWHAEYNEKQVAQACEDTFQHIAGQTQRMKQQIKQELRKESAEVFRMAAVQGISRKKAYRTLRDKILSKTPDFKFIDKAGRKWDSKVYLDMMTHTVMAQAQNDIYANTMANEGIDLVKIPANGARDACRNWENKVLSLTGSTKGYPTLAEAKATGEIFHPRCRHRFVAYDKSIDDIFEKQRNAA